MAREPYETSTLLAVVREQEEASNYWLDLLYPNTINFTDEFIDLSKIPAAGRKLAPFVAPLAQGRPIYEEGAREIRFRPAYVKPKDPVTPTRPLVRRPGELFNSVDVTPGERYDAIVADILAFHKLSIERTWEWLGAQAAIYGKVTLDHPDYPKRVVDFGRDANHDVTLGAGARWGDAGVSVVDFIQDQSDTMQLAEFGGAPDRITMGTKAWSAFRKSEEVKDLLDIGYRGDDTTINRGLTTSGQVRRVGNLSGTLDVYVYSDYYSFNGVNTPFMDPRDIVLSSSAVNGYRAFGAILDPHADYQPLAISPRVFTQDDPPATFVMSQSSPLMVPVNPNATLRARVVA